MDDETEKKWPKASPCVFLQMTCCLSHSRKQRRGGVREMKKRKTIWENSWAPNNLLSLWIELYALLKSSFKTTSLKLLFHTNSLVAWTATLVPFFTSYPSCLGARCCHISSTTWIPINLPPIYQGWGLQKSAWLHLLSSAKQSAQSQRSKNGQLMVTSPHHQLTKSCQSRQKNQKGPMGRKA